MAYKPQAGPTMSAPNVIPMADIMLVLLIIFMVITPLTPKGLEALVPQPTPPNQKPDNDLLSKTIVVQVSRRVPHPLYRRIVMKHKKFYAHDEENSARVGDVVRIIECRPMSKLKRWRLGDVIRRSALVGAAQPADLDVKI